MYFDRRWWGIHNMDWALYYLERGQLLSVNALLDRDFFFSQDCAVTYPIMGAFTEFLISTYGIAQYKEFYQAVDSRTALCDGYGCTVVEEFVNWLQLFRLDEGVKRRIKALLA